MATYREVAMACGVSKQHIYNVVHEIDPDGAHINKSGYRNELDEWLVSAVVDEVMKRKRQIKPKVADSVEVVTAAHKTVRDSMQGHYDVQIKTLNEQHAALVKEKDERIADLKKQLSELHCELAAERAAHEATRKELAISRELEGLHMPGHRARVLSKYALPERT